MPIRNCFSGVENQIKPASDVIVVSNFSDRRKWDFYDLAVSTFNFYTWSSECLGSFQTMYGSAHAVSVRCKNFDVRFTVKRL